VKAEVAAIVKVREIRAFDGSPDCIEHRVVQATHIGTVLVVGHRIVALPLCTECAQMWLNGTDWRGRPAGARS
jgi:hypothetical protein